jgi:D-alanyl-D-alanine carboxypeptidase
MKLKWLSILFCILLVTTSFAVGIPMNVSAAAGSDTPDNGTGGDIQPGSDVTPPEAVIRFDLSSHEIVVEGQDDLDGDVNVRVSVQSVKGQKSVIYYELTDDAGNMIGLLAEYFCVTGNLEFKALELKSSAGEVIIFEENHYKIEYKLDKTTGELIHLHQNIHVADNYKLNSYYTTSGQTTSLEYEEKGAEKIKHKVGGLALVYLNTDENNIELRLLVDGRELSFEALRPCVQRIVPSQLLEYDRLMVASEIPAKVRFGDLSGVPEYMSGRWAADRNLRTPGAKAVAFIETYGELFRLNPRHDLLRPVEVWNSEELVVTNVRLQQYYDGVPVLGAELIVHLNRNHDIEFVNGVFVPELDLNTKPRIGAGEVKSTVETDLKNEHPRIQIQSYDPEVLSVYHRSALDRYSEGEGILVWKMVINTVLPDGEWFYLVNARTGEIVEAWNNYQGINSENMPWNDLLYLRQPGAIHEAYASIFEGSLDCTKPLSDPHWYGEIDHWDQFIHFRGTCDPANDNCGVELNSGIITKMFRLIAYGGSHYGLATNGIGTTLTKKVFLTTITDTGLTTSATLHEFRDVMFETGSRMIGGSSGFSIQGQVAVQTVWLSAGILIIEQTFGWETNDDYDLFGWSFAKGDFDKDTFEDLAISIPFEDVKADNDGMAIVFYGSVFGLSSTGSERLTLYLANSNYMDDDNFGLTMVAGDFNGDDYDDLAIGVPKKDLPSKTDFGQVVIYYGSDDGLVPDASSWPPLALPPTTETLSQALAGDPNDNNDQFGFSLAAGDFDNDTFDDLAIGTPLNTCDAIHDGLVIVFYGTEEGFIPDGDFVLPIPLPNTECIYQTDADNDCVMDDQFGYSLGAGDFNYDGHDDLAVGVPFEDFDGKDNNGQVIVFYGSTDGLIPSLDFELLDQEMGDEYNEDGDRFGYSLAVGNFDNDEYMDLAVGMPFEDHWSSNEGYVIVFFGNYDGLATVVIPDQAVVIHQVESLHEGLACHGPHQDNYFGEYLTVADFDGDSFDDLAVGVPLNFIYDEGVVDVFYGSVDGLIPLRSYWLEMDYFGASPFTNDLFAQSLIGGDFNGNGKDELAVGAPGADISNIILDAGRVFIRELEPAVPEITASGAIVYSRTLDRVIGILCPNEARPMASTTKIMTALLTIERINLPLGEPGKLNLNDPVFVDINGDYVGGSAMYGNLTYYDVLSLQDILYGLMLPSGNDAAVVIAEHISGYGAGEQGGAFSDLMNVRADELGLTKTNYKNPYGTHHEFHYTTPFDLARLSDFALDDSLFSQIVGTYQYTTTSWVDSTNTPKNTQQNNTNYFLNTSSGWHWSIAYGVKTGTSSAAGSCLVSAINDGTVDLIAVVLNSETRYSDSYKILDWGIDVHP